MHSPDSPRTFPHVKRRQDRRIVCIAAIVTVMGKVDSLDRLHIIDYAIIYEVMTHVPS